MTGIGPGTRALGIAESFDPDSTNSTLAGAVVRADRTVEAFEFGTCTVGGTDATDAILGLWQRLDRPDVQWCLVAAVAPAWFNVLDLEAIQTAVDRPLVAVTGEERTAPLARTLAEEFDGPALRRRQELAATHPTPTEISLGDGQVFVRALGCSLAAANEAVRAFTHRRPGPEPLETAQAAARGARTLRDRVAGP